MSPKTIKGKIVIKGQIMATSPLHIGCGDGERSDLDVLLDQNNKPYIPATSFVGVLRHTILESLSEKGQNKRLLDELWGFSENTDGHQSLFQCSDLVCLTDSPEIRIRDGIKIDNSTGVVFEQGKYDYEIVERETRFSLNMVFSYNSQNESLAKKVIATIYSLLENGKLQFGAKTNNGLGEVKLIVENTKIYEFKFTEKIHVYNWLIQNFTSQNEIQTIDLGEPYEINVENFHIEAILKLKHSLIIRSYSEDPEMADATHIKSLEDWILTGTSLKGAIRSRAERILNTINQNDEVFKQLFGDVDEKSPTKKAIKAKIRIKEVVLPRFIAELQTRIKIDRFTGGTIETALFDSMPLFMDLSDKVLVINMFVRDCTFSEAGLLLLILKDLWTGDLAVGGEKNIGRGVFEGIKARITWNKQPKIVIEKDLQQLAPTDKSKLQSFVDALKEGN